MSTAASIHWGIIIVVMREKNMIVTIDFFCLSKKRARVMMRWYDLPVSACRAVESPVGS